MRSIAVLLVLGACGGGAAGDDVDAALGPDAATGPQLVVPAVLSLPYVVAGAGPSQRSVTVSNPGTADLTAITWQLAGDPDLAIVTAPDALAAGDEATLTVAWAGAAAPRIAGGTLTADSAAGPRAAEVWAVAGDPALGDATFAPVTGPGGVTIGESAIVHMPTAPFPDGSAPWTDDRVHLFVPDGWRERAAQDVVLHFHGHSTTIDATVPGHLYREQVYASGADVVLVVPQGPVNTASGDFGKLSDPAGTAAFLDEVLTVLYRAGVVTRPALGQVTLTSHSGGYVATAQNLASPPFDVGQVDLFDSVYGYVSTFRDFALAGGVLRSDYTSGGGTDANNLDLAAQLTAAGAPPADAPTQRALRDAGAVVYFADTSHTGSTRIDTAYGEQLRWGARHSRRGPRAELRSVVAAGGIATATWLAPHDDDLAGWRVETSPDGAAWAVAAEVAADADHASFALAGGARVRLVPVVDGVADPQPSDTYRVDDGADVLVVDGFDRVIDGSWGGLAHDFAARVGEAAGAVHTASNEAVTEDGFDLTPYRAVVWLLGDESSDDHTFTAAERAAIDAYLAAGGRVVISGSEVGYDLATVTGGAAFLARTAGAVYAADDAGTGSAHGAGALAAVAAFDFGGAGAPYVEDFPDTFTAAASATVVLQYATGAAAAVGIAGHGVLVGFPLETVESPAALAALVPALVAFVAPP